MILSLQTNTFGTYGGIPTYNRLVCRVLEELDSRSGNCVLLAMDKKECVEQAAQTHPNLRLTGFGGDRGRFVAAAMSIVAREPINLVLAGHPNYAPVCMLLKLLRPRLRFGVFIYGWDAWMRLSPMRRWALRRADFIISISEYTKQQGIAINGLDEQRISILPNALEWTTVEADESAATCDLPSGTRLLSVGRLDSLEQQKGFDTVIKALPLILDRVPDAQYIVVGSGTDLDRHRQLAADMGVSERVHFLGNVADATLRHCYKNCDLFVMPSAQEGFGFVYLEAMQYAKAVVAARSGGAPEVVEDQITGRLVEYGNETELAQALIELCLDEELRTRLGAAGYQRLQEKFTYPIFKQKLSQILTEQLAVRMTSAGQARVSQSTPEIP